ncbi:hypothetical protein [Propionigenium maris]|nr:hypothetical protein [Propionigenium maris]
MATLRSYYDPKEKSVMESLNERLDAYQRADLLEAFAKNKEKASSKANKIKFEESILDLRSYDLGERTNGQFSSKGILWPSIIRLSYKLADEKFSRQVAVLDHELTHKDQHDLTANTSVKRAKKAGLDKTRSNFKYDLKHYDASNKRYYKASLLERDAKESIDRTKNALETIARKALKTNAVTEEGGYIAVSKPKNTIVKGLEKVEVERVDNNFRFLRESKETFTSKLSEKNKRELEELLLDYQEIEDLYKEGKTVKSTRDLMVLELDRKVDEFQRTNDISFDLAESERI